MLLTYATVDFLLFYDGAADIKIWEVSVVSDTHVTVKTLGTLALKNLSLQRWSQIILVGKEEAMNSDKRENNHDWKYILQVTFYNKMNTASLRRRGFKRPCPVDLYVSTDWRISYTSRSVNLSCWSTVVLNGSAVEKSRYLIDCRSHLTNLLCHCLLRIFCRHVKKNKFLAQCLGQYF